MNADVKNAMLEKAKSAIADGNVDAFVNELTDFVENTKNEILADYQELKDVKDQKILEARGYKALTSNEIKFYENLTKSIKGQSLSDIDVTIPEETFNRVFEDLTVDHPLLAHVDFIDTKSLVAKFIVNTGISGVAGWGEICATIDDEIESGFAFKEIPQNKLSAYMELCKVFVDLGYIWLDRYVRICLGEAIALGLEDAIINGTGSSMPIGLIKEVVDAGEEQTIPATTKDAVAVNDLSAGTLGGIAATLSKNGTRTVSRIVMVVNPADYYGKVIPATRIMNAAGQWVEYTPFPVTFVPSVKMAQNKAVFFRDKGYQALVGLGKEGRIEKSDQYKFYEDLLCYKIKLVGGGLPKDNTAVYADITNLKASYFTVKVAEEEVSA